MSSKSKIIVLLPNLNVGGAQKNLLKISSILSKSAEVTVVCFSVNGFYKESFESNAYYEIRYLKGNKYSKILQLYTILKNKAPDKLISGMFLYNLYTGILLKFFKYKGDVYYRETAVLSKMKLTFLQRFLYSLVFKSAKKIISQSADMTEDLCANFNVPRNKIYLVHNSIEEKKHLNPTTGKRHFLIVGRLEKEKNIYGFLQILHKRQIEIPLLIIGEGKEKDWIKDIINNSPYLNNTRLIGYQSNLEDYIKESKALILPSKVEGMPNIALEVLSYGIPIIANNFKGGVNEILNEKNGVITDLSKCDKLSYYLSDKFLDRFNRNKIALDITERFSTKKFEKLITELFINHA